MKKIGLILILFFIPIMTFALVQQAPTIYVTDEANVIKDETEDYIIQYSSFLAKTKGIRYYVVAVPSLEGYDLDSYVDYVFQSFKMGDKGVLLFISQEEGLVKVLFGDKISSIMSEVEMNSIIQEYFISYLSNGNWDKGIKNGYVAFYKRICDYYHIDASMMELESGNRFLIKYQYPIMAVLIIASMLTSYYLCSFFTKRKKKKSYILFILICTLNGGILTVAYLMNPWMIFLVLGCEVLAATSAFGSRSNTSLEDALTRIKKDEMKKRHQKKRVKIQKRKVKR